MENGVVIAAGETPFDSAVKTLHKQEISIQMTAIKKGGSGWDATKILGEYTEFSILTCKLCLNVN